MKGKVIRFWKPAKLEKGKIVIKAGWYYKIVK